MLKKIVYFFWLALWGLYPINRSYAAIGLLTDSSTSRVYSFDPDNLSVPATSLLHSANGVDIITISPDGTMAYFTDGTSKVFSFPTNGPYIPTVVASGLLQPVGIAVTNDGTTLYIAADSPSNIYTVPATGGTVTTLTSTGAVIQSPLFVAINGDTAYIADYSDGQIFSFPITPSQTSYNATLLQSVGGTNVGGIAISSDGFLYWSSSHAASSGNWVYRVPIVFPTVTPTLVGTGPVGDVVLMDGLSVSCDGTTVFLVSQRPVGSGGLWSIPTNQGLPQAAIQDTSIGIDGAVSVAIGGCPIPTPPSGLRGVQKKCDFGLVYERCNILNWDRGPIGGVLFYRIYRNGVPIATVSANTFSYKDNDRKKGVPTQYTVTTVRASGETPIGSVTIQ